MASDTFVDPARLDELRSLPSVNWDLTRLVRLCEELNVSFQTGSFHAVAALTRAMLDHVPPIFGCTSFEQVANNYAGSRSFRESMKYLQASARKIGDAHLHTQIRGQEVLPSAMQVDVRPAIDVLLGEIVRVNKVEARRLDEMEAKVSRANELIEDFLCPSCHAPIARREPGWAWGPNDWDDIEWEDVYYECGRRTHDGEEVEPCSRKRR